MTDQPTVQACPSQHLHQWHPSGYMQHSSWAEDAIRVADQRRCPGCDGFEIWIPKRKNLRLRGPDWPWTTCVGITSDGKPCKQEPICERLFPDDQSFVAGVEGPWWPVCYRHTGLKTVTT